MNMKKFAALSLSLLMLVGVFAGCSDKDDEKEPSPDVSSTPVVSPSDTPDTTPETTPSDAPDTTPDGGEADPVAQKYADAITAARDEEINSAYPVVTSAADEYTLSLLGLTAEDMESYALSISLMNVKAYGIAAIKPVEGKEQAVVDGLNSFVELQQQNFEQYLADQYEIAKAAKVETLSDGTVLLVMCEDSETVFESVKTALEG